MVVMMVLAVVCGQVAWSYRELVWCYVESVWSRYVVSTPDEPAFCADSAIASEPLHSIAMPRNEDNDDLLRNEVTADVISRLLSSGEIFVRDGKGGYKPASQTATIKISTGLAPNGRAESRYGRLVAALRSIDTPHLTVGGDRRIER